MDLERFDEIAINKRTRSALLHADETGINVDGKKIWLHSVSNELGTYFYPHSKIGILPKFNGILCRDHWKSYFKYSCTHALCNDRVIP